MRGRAVDSEEDRDEQAQGLANFRRARLVLAICAGFWLWLLIGGPGWIPGVYNGVGATLLALYAAAAIIPPSIFAALIAASFMLRYRRNYQQFVADTPELSRWVKIRATTADVRRWAVPRLRTGWAQAGSRVKTLRTDKVLPGADRPVITPPMPARQPSVHARPVPRGPRPPRPRASSRPESDESDRMDPPRLSA